MTFPRISDTIIYEYDGQKVIVWQQDIFNKVYIKTIPQTDESTWTSVNWWKFLFDAKVVDRLKDIKKSAY